MELPPLPQNSLNSGDTARVPTNLALTKLLEMTVGETLSARVIQAALATEKQRDQLLQQLLNKYQPGGTPDAKTQQIKGQEGIGKTLGQTLAQQAYQTMGGARQTIIPPALLSAISQSSQDRELLKLLQSPQLKLLEVNVKGKTVVTYTDKPVSQGENLLLKMAGTNRLTVIDTRVSQRPADNSDTEQARAVVRDALRTALPNQQGLQKVLTALQQVHQLTPPQKRDLMPPPLQNAVQKVLSQLPKLQELSQPAGVKNALRNSGVQWEAKLANQTTITKPVSSDLNTSPQKNDVAPLTSGGRQQNRANTGSTPADQLMRSATRLRASNTSNPGRNIYTANSGRNINTPLHSPGTSARTQTSGQAGALNNDIKANLLNVLARTAPLLEKPPMTNTPGLDRLFAANPKSGNPDLVLQQLLQNIGAGKKVGSSGDSDQAHRATRNQLTQIIHQYILASLAKVQMQQLHSLSHQHLSPEASQATQSWLMELPFKFGNDIHSVEVRIDDEWREQEDAEGDKQKVRQWEVMLSFELPEMGNFYAHLKVIDDTVSAKLWAEQTLTFIKTQKQIKLLREQLSNNGIEVKELQCFQGQPDKKELQLGYSLVDIRT